MPDEDVMVTVRLPANVAQDATPTSVATFLGINTSDLNEAFGVVPIDKSKGVFSLMMSPARLDNISEETKGFIEGPFANPKIAPFGPLE